jgi:hypothetical protein
MAAAASTRVRGYWGTDTSKVSGQEGRFGRKCRGGPYTWVKTTSAAKGEELFDVPYSGEQHMYVLEPDRAAKGPELMKLAKAHGSVLAEGLDGVKWVLLSNTKFDEYNHADEKFTKVGFEECIVYYADLSINESWVAFIVPNEAITDDGDEKEDNILQEVD